MNISLGFVVLMVALLVSVPVLMLILRKTTGSARLEQPLDDRIRKDEAQKRAG